MNWLTATVAMRPLAMRAGSTAPARSTCAMIQPPKMSPLPLASAGIGITRITSSRSSGRRERRRSTVACGRVLVHGSRPYSLHLGVDGRRILPRHLRTMRRSPPRSACRARCRVGRRASAGPTGARCASCCPTSGSGAGAWRSRWPAWSRAKLANIGVPLVLKSLVDALDLKPGDPRSALVVPVALLLAYGALRLSITLFTELREFLFYPVAARIARQRLAARPSSTCCAEPALSPRAPDRRRVARHRARLARDPLAAQLHRSTTSCRRWSRSRW